MGSRLPSEQEVLIIRPTGIMGNRNIRKRMTQGFRGPCQEARHSKAGSEGEAVQTECSSCRV